MQWIKSNKGLTLIELIVSILVSSIVILSAIMFFSLALTQYRNAAEETDLMMESQIAVNIIKEVVMEAKEPVEAGSYTEGAVSYPYIAVKTGSSVNPDGTAGAEEYYHLFVLDIAGGVLLYHREAGGGPGSAENAIRSTVLADGMINKTDLKQYFLAEHVQGMSMDNTNPQLLRLSMEFVYNGRTYLTEETILVRNTLTVTN